MTDLQHHYAGARTAAQAIDDPELQQAAHTAVDLAEGEGVDVWTVLRASGLHPHERAALARAWDQVGPGREYEEFLT